MGDGDRGALPGCVVSLFVSQAGEQGGGVSPPNRVLQCYNPRRYGVKCVIRVLHRVLQ